MYERLASAIYNDVYGGLKGYHINNSLSIEQLQDEIVETRLALIKEYSLKGILPTNDLYMAINCIQVDCENLERCCKRIDNGTPTAHFEIPQIITDFGTDSIAYIGSIDRLNSFSVYIGSSYDLDLIKYRKRKKNKPVVYIDPVPNSNNMYDCFIFNAPYIKTLSIVALFKDLRQLEQYSCCMDLDEIDQKSFLNLEIKTRLTKEKLAYYRQYSPLVQPNDLAYK